MSQNSDDLTTQPTATALMERVQQVEVRLAQNIDTRAARLEGQISSLREEIVKSFKSLNNKVMTLNEDNLDVRANQREILKRLNDLEITVKAS